MANTGNGKLLYGGRGYGGNVFGIMKQLSPLCTSKNSVVLEKGGVYMARTPHVALGLEPDRTSRHAHRSLSMPSRWTVVSARAFGILSHLHIFWFNRKHPGIGERGCNCQRRKLGATSPNKVTSVYPQTYPHLSHRNNTRIIMHTRAHL